VKCRARILDPGKGDQNRKGRQAGREGGVYGTYRLMVIGVAVGLKSLPGLCRLHELEVVKDEAGFFLGHGAGGEEGGREEMNCEEGVLPAHSSMHRKGGGEPAKQTLPKPQIHRLSLPFFSSLFTYSSMSGSASLKKSNVPALTIL